MKKIINLNRLMVLTMAMATLMVLVFACSGGDDDDDAYGDDDSNSDDDAGDDDSGGDFVEVSISNSNMSPDPVNIVVGQTVRWTNEDSMDHTVTSGNPDDAITGSIFDSGPLGNGDTFEFTFTAAGTYFYFCSFHSSTMNGYQIIVE